jgi:hypothetical protein
MPSRAGGLAAGPFLILDLLRKEISKKIRNKTSHFLLLLRDKTELQ